MRDTLIAIGMWLGVALIVYICARQSLDEWDRKHGRDG